MAVAWVAAWVEVAADAADQAATVGSLGREAEHVGHQ